MKKFRLLILDANVIIEVHKHGFWSSLINQFDIHINSIVIHNEAHFYEDDQGQRHDINLETDVKSKKVTEIEATPEQISALTDLVNENLLNRIDAGEQEALALLLSGDDNDYKYCAGDTRAIKALASLSLATHGVSLEEVLTSIGQKNKFPHPSYSKKAFDQKKRLRDYHQAWSWQSS